MRSEAKGPNVEGAKKNFRRANKGRAKASVKKAKFNRTHIKFKTHAK